MSQQHGHYSTGVPGDPCQQEEGAAAQDTADWAWKELCNPLGSIPTAIWSSIFNCRSFIAGDDACAGAAPPRLWKLGLQGHMLENHLFSF